MPGLTNDRKLEKNRLLKDRPHKYDKPIFQK
jgi:hypothetical protein